MKVMGIDPGYHRVGIAVLDITGSEFSVEFSTTIETDPGEALMDRLLQIHEEIARAISEQSPDSVAVEEIFFSRNVKTAIGVAHARGVILLAVSRAGIPLYEYKPASVKLAVTSNGQARKAQVAFMVGKLLGVDLTGKLDDEVDAIAVALCHAFLHKSKPRPAEVPEGGR